METKLPKILQDVLDTSTSKSWQQVSLPKADFPTKILKKNKFYILKFDINDDIVLNFGKKASVLEVQRFVKKIAATERIVKSAKIKYLTFYSGGVDKIVIYRNKLVYSVYILPESTK